MVTSNQCVSNILRSVIENGHAWPSAGIIGEAANLLDDIGLLLGRLAECFGDDEQEFADIKLMRDRLAGVDTRERHAATDESVRRHAHETDCLRRFAEWAAGAACDDEYAPRMVKHIAAIAKDALAGNADIAGYPTGISSRDEIEQLRERVKDLQQFHDWAEPQVHDHGRDVLEIERLRAALQGLVDWWESDEGRIDDVIEAGKAALAGSPPVETTARGKCDGTHPVLIESKEQPGVNVYVCARCDATVDLIEYRVSRSPEEPSGRQADDGHCPECAAYIAEGAPHAWKCPRERHCVCGLAVIPEGELRMEVGPTTHRLAGPCFQTSSVKASENQK